jgi:hypothetical protein
MPWPFRKRPAPEPTTEEVVELLNQANAYGEGRDFQLTAFLALPDDQRAELLAVLEHSYGMTYCPHFLVKQGGAVARPMWRYAGRKWPRTDDPSQDFPEGWEFPVDPEGKPTP